MIDSMTILKSGTSSPRQTTEVKKEPEASSSVGFTDYLDGQITKEAVEKRSSSRSQKDTESEEDLTPEMPETPETPDMPEIPPQEAAGNETAARRSSGGEESGGVQLGSNVPPPTGSAGGTPKASQFKPVSNALSSRSGAANHPAGGQAATRAATEGHMEEALTNGAQKSGMIDVLPEMIAAVSQSVSGAAVAGSATKGVSLDAAVSSVFEGPGILSPDGSVRLSALPGGDTPVPGAAAMDENALKFDDLVERFDRRLLSMVQQGEKVMRITVQPAAMGRLTVSCTEGDAGMSLEIVAQHSGVRDVIAQQEDAIRRLMQEHSVELGNFDVLLDEGGGGQRQNRGGEVQQAQQRSLRGIAPAMEQGDEPQTLRQENKGGAVYLVA